MSNYALFDHTRTEIRASINHMTGLGRRVIAYLSGRPYVRVPVKVALSRPGRPNASVPRILTPPTRSAERASKVARKLTKADVRVSDEAMNSRARRAATRVGLTATKSRTRVGTCDNWGGFMLTNSKNRVEGGGRYELSAEDVLDYCTPVKSPAEMPSTGDLELDRLLEHLRPDPIVKFAGKGRKAASRARSTALKLNADERLR